MDAGPIQEAQAQRRDFRAALPFLLRAWSTITWRQIAWTLAIGVAGEVLFVAVSHAFTLYLQAGWPQRFAKFFGSLGYEAATAFFFLFCIVAADHAVRAGAPRFRSYVLAAVVAAFLGAAFDSLFRHFVLGWFDQPYVRWWWKPVHPISHFMWYLLIGGFITFVYADLRRSRDSAARLHAAVMRRTRAARDVLQTRLQAMQARVDPQFLLDTLDRIKVIYRSDSSQGQRTLDDLISYLRTAMPQMHDSASTLGREIELVRCYVAIVAGRDGVPVRLHFEKGDRWTQAPFPPMLLLPLVEHAVACGDPGSPAARVISLHATRHQDRLQVTIGHGGDAFASDREDDAVRVVCEHLRVLFDGRARLDLRSLAGGASLVVIDVPQ